MPMKVTNYILFLISLMGVLFTIELYKSNHSAVAMTGLALEPVIHLVNTKLYLEEDHTHRSKSELSSAIRKTYLLKEKVEHKESLRLLDQTLPELVKLHNQAGTGHEYHDKLNESCVKTLLALTYIQIRHAKTACMGERPHEMKLAIKKAMFILKKSLVLSEGTKKDYEVDIYARLSDVLDAKFDQAQASKELDELLEEIHDLEVSFDNNNLQAGI